MAYGATIQVWPALVSLKTLIAYVSGQILLKKDSTAEKLYSLFPNVLKRSSFQKKWNSFFLALSGKMVFLFPENMILLFRRK